MAPSDEVLGEYLRQQKYEEEEKEEQEEQEAHRI